MHLALEKRTLGAREDEGGAGAVATEHAEDRHPEGVDSRSLEDAQAVETDPAAKGEIVRSLLKARAGLR